jgi:hypothetical protein
MFFARDVKAFIFSFVVVVFSRLHSCSTTIIFHLFLLEHAKGSLLARAVAAKLAENSLDVMEAKPKNSLAPVQKVPNNLQQQIPEILSLQPQQSPMSNMRMKTRRSFLTSTPRRVATKLTMTLMTTKSLSPRP